MKKWIVLLLLATWPWLAIASNIQQLIQLTDYVGVDYGGAVTDGRVISPGEYSEMQDFSSAIAEQIALLPLTDARRQLTGQAMELARLINQRAAGTAVQKLAASMRQLMIRSYKVTVTPRQPPDLEAGRRLYAQQCVSCHGLTGQGNGPLAQSLEPRPIDFTRRDRYQNRTLLGLYNTISNGQEGTAMQAYSELTEAQRWALAFYVGQLATTKAEQTAGQTVLKQLGDKHQLAQTDYMVTHSPAEVVAVNGQDGALAMAYLRAHPKKFFHTTSGSQLLEFSRSRLVDSLAAYQAGDRDSAYAIAVEAYLEGFELMESNIGIVDPELGKETEAAMTAYRNLIRKGAPPARLATSVQHIGTLLETIEAKLDKTALSGRTAFVSSLLILLREGLEALLVVAALAAFLIKTDRRDGLVYLWAGIGGAFLLGGVTWVVANTYVDISGAHRELAEGFAALFAAAMLFSVGFWMQRKSSAQQWRTFIQARLQQHLGAGTLWGLAGLSFIAVYREIFEVVLFYQALWIQTSAEGQSMIFSGLLTAAALLLVLGWLILRYSTRLPLRQFFAISGLFMFLLAFVFTGNGIAALQEAGKIPLNPINIPSIRLLGIYPNVQSSGVQLLLVVVTVLMLYYYGPGRTKSGS